LLRRVVSLTERRLAALPPDTRPLPSVAQYDQLLRRRAAGHGSAAAIRSQTLTPYVYTRKLMP